MKKIFTDKHCHHCRCGFERALERLRAKTGKRLGALGATFMILHLLFHVVECIVVPAILVGINQQISTEDAVATSETQTVTEGDSSVDETAYSSYDLLSWDFADASQKLTLSYRL